MTKAYVTYQSRGYLRRAGYRRLETVLTECATLYNAALQERRDAYRMCGESVSRVDQFNQFTDIRKEDPIWGGLSLQIGRGVLHRADRAFQSFFRRVKRGETPGFPRFKPRQRYTCIEIAEPWPSMVRKVNGNVWVTVKGLPAIRLREHRDLPDGKPVSLRINLHPAGLTVDMVYPVEKEALEPTGESVGLDMGVNVRIALSDGSMVEPRQTDRRKERRIQRAVSRCVKGSNRRKKRNVILSKHRRKNRVKNRNATHRVTTELVRRYDRIAVEKLAIPNMVKSARGTVENPGTNVSQKRGLNREIRNQTWGIIREQLRYKAAWAGRELVEVDPRNTSRECHVCGSITPQQEYRMHRCGVCGHESDRDTNAAINILKRAFGPTGRGLSPEADNLRVGLES